MNLYRSFGNLLETWVAEGVPYSHTQEEPWLRRDDSNPVTVSGSTLTSVSDMGIGVRSESVDSGVELASSDISLPSPGISAPSTTGSAETDPVPAQREEDGLTRPSTSQTPVLSPPSSTSTSSSSPWTSPARAQSSRERSVALHCKVEQALQRTGPRSQSLKQSPSPQVVLRQQSQKSSLVVRQVSEDHTTGQRSGSLGRKNTSQQNTSGHIRRPLSLHHSLPKAKIITKNQGDKQKEGLSPGLSYLERVCQMLEEIARLQKDNRGLQLEMDALLESKQSAQASESLFCDCKAIAEEPISSETCEMNSEEHISTETQWQNNNDNHDFRRRSASDTNVLAHHLRKVKPNSRGQHVNINDLLEQAEDHENQEETSKQTHRKLKIGSLRRDETAQLSDTEKNSQQKRPSQKKASRHRLSQLFRRRRKTIPI